MLACVRGLKKAPRMSRTPQTFVLVKECRLTFFQNYLAPEVESALLRKLLGDFDFEQRSISLFGQRVMQPRLIAWGGEPSYRYSGDTLMPRQLPSAAQALLEQVNQTLSEESPDAPPFNHILANLYRDESDSMGAHSDDERELGSTPTIASLSLGAERELRLRLKKKFTNADGGDPRAKTSSSALNLRLTSGSLLLMHPPTQKYFLHSVPKQKKVVAQRLNLTFRALLA